VNLRYANVRNSNTNNKRATVVVHLSFVVMCEL